MISRFVSTEHWVDGACVDHGCTDDGRKGELNDDGWMETELKR